MPTEPPRPQGRSEVALGDGRRVPYPTPTSEAATRAGRGNVRTGTKPEIQLRSALHRLGLRFRKDLPIRTAARVIRPDVVFTRARVAVFVDGCFWHGCPEHQRVPKSNPDYWIPKLARNVERDHLTNHALSEAGWIVLRFWEHEPPEVAARAVREVVGERSSPSAPTQSTE